MKKLSASLSNTIKLSKQRGMKVLYTLMTFSEAFSYEAFSTKCCPDVNNLHFRFSLLLQLSVTIYQICCSQQQKITCLIQFTAPEPFQSTTLPKKKKKKKQLHWQIFALVFSINSLIFIKYFRRWHYWKHIERFSIFFHWFFFFFYIF